jgi:type IV secretory pathway protease TraF
MHTRQHVPIQTGLDSAANTCETPHTSPRSVAARPRNRAALRNSARLPAVGLSSRAANRRRCSPRSSFNASSSPIGFWHVTSKPDASTQSVLYLTWRNCGTTGELATQRTWRRALLALPVALHVCLVACCLVVGCRSVDLRGEPFPDDPLSRAGRQLRIPERDSESFAFSNKARQIERNLGIGTDQ